MDIAKRIAEYRNNIEYDSKCLSFDIDKEKESLRKVIKLNFDSSINLFNLKNKVDIFYDEINIDFGESKINLKKKDFIYYFSIFSSFDYICLLFLYLKGEFNSSYSSEFNNTVIYLNLEYKKIFNNISKKILRNEKENSRLIINIREYLKIPIEKMNDKQFIRDEFNKFKTIITKKNNIHKEILKLEKDKSNLNEIIDEKNFLKNEIDKIKDDIQDKDLKIIWLKNEIINLKKHRNDKKITNSIEGEIDIFEKMNDESLDLREQINILTQDIKVLNKNLDNLKKDRELEEKKKYIKELENKIKILGDKPKLIKDLEIKQNEEKILLEKKGIDIELIQNKISISKFNLFKLNKNLNLINKKIDEIKYKDDVDLKNIDNYKEKIKILAEERTKSLNKMEFTMNEYDSLEKTIKKKENSISKEKILFLSKNKEYLKELSRLENIEKDVEEYLDYLNMKELNNRNLINYIESGSLENNIASMLGKIKLDSLYSELGGILAWKLNINIQITIYKFMGELNKNLINGVYSSVNNHIKNNKKILFKNDINQNMFLTCFNKMKELKEKMLIIKINRNILNDMDNELKILKKF
jgi:hypothetical protein